MSPCLGVLLWGSLCLSPFLPRRALSRRARSWPVAHSEAYTVAMTGKKILYFSTTFASAVFRPVAVSSVEGPTNLGLVRVGCKLLL